MLQHLGLTWVQSVRATGKPAATGWIMKSPSLCYYYDRLEDAGDFDLVENNKDTDEDASSELSTHTDLDNMHAMELVEELLNGCASLEKTRQDYEALMRSTTYVSWWTSKPSEAVESSGRNSERSCWKQPIRESTKRNPTPVRRRPTEKSFQAFHQIAAAISRYRQKALASCICRGVRHSASNT